MIRRRLVLSISAVAAVAVLLGGWLVLVALEDRLVDNLDRDFRNGRLSTDLRGVLSEFGPDVRRSDRYDPVQGLAIVRYDAAGELVASIATGSRSDPDPLPDAAGVTPGDGLRTVGSDGGPRYRVAALDAPAGGVVVVGVSMATIDETIQDARRILRVFGLGSVGLIATLSWVIVRRGFSPIEGMIASADRIAAGDLTERIAASEETSEVGRLGSALDTMLDRIEEAVAAKTDSEERMRRFVAEASHELRTPLTSVRGYAELYRKGADDPAEVATAMTRIEAEANRMQRLVEDLLQLARLDRAAAPQRSVVDLVAVAGHSVDAARVVDGERTYDLDVEPGLDAALDADPDQLRQVVDNLLTNARVHTPVGTTVTTSVRISGSAAVVEVADDGPGFSPTDVGRAFDRFWRSTRTDRNPVAGTGLGLAIVRSIVRSHGGDVVLDERPGGGARFTVSLPLSVPLTGASPPSSPDRPEASRAPKTPRGPAPSPDSPTGEPS